MQKAALSRRARTVLDDTAILEGGTFAPCVPDLTHFPFLLWQRLLGKAWRGVRGSDTQYASSGGHPALRQAIAEHVQLARQVRCTPGQVVIVNGAQHGLDLCARLLADAGERVWVEDPGYPGARRAFRAADLELVPVGLDAEGMAPSARHHKLAPRLVYITPSHQFPTGTVMSLRRRCELLAIAARHGSWIIEDDYDGEFRFSGRPIAALQGIDEEQRVIYLGTFSKVMFPGLRLGYLVLPEQISERFARASALLAFEGRQVTQAALAAFMQEGHFASHIRRMRMLYAERRALLGQVWQRELGELAPLGGGDTGIHMVAQLPHGTDQGISDAALETGIVAQSLRSLFIGRPDRAGLVLGYGAVHEREIRRQGTALARLVKRTLA
jgi:GntR family transcriptional regulator / MocR family aminotransferase